MSLPAIIQYLRKKRQRYDYIPTNPGSEEPNEYHVFSKPHIKHGKQFCLYLEGANLHVNVPNPDIIGRMHPGNEFILVQTIDINDPTSIEQLLKLIPL